MNDKLALKPFTVAAPQYGPMQSDIEVNRKLSINALRDCRKLGADLVVLPELCPCRYIMPERTDYMEAAEPIDGPTVKAWLDVARELKLHVVGGFVEKVGKDLFNSAALLGPDGLVGLYRKTHLWEYEHDVFAYGDKGLPVYNTPIGRIGLLICFDLRFPECPRLLALQGADVICIPTGWNTMVNKNPFDSHGYIQGTYLTIAQANSNRVPIVCVNRVGKEESHIFLGKSIIVDANGTVLAGPASHIQEEILVASIDPNLSRDKGYGTKSDLFGDRRTDLYGEMLGYFDRANEY